MVADGDDGHPRNISMVFFGQQVIPVRHKPLGPILNWLNGLRLACRSARGVLHLYHYEITIQLANKDFNSLVSSLMYNIK